jgi:ketosteroid isomerase-like protein
MDHKSLKSWLDAYGRAWETRDSAAVIRLFTEDATYEETPFIDPLRGHAEIEAYWIRAVGHHENVHFSHEILTSSDGRCIAHWWCSFDRLPGGKRVRLDGIFVLDFDGGGRCRRLREWWHRHEV